MKISDEAQKDLEQLLNSFTDEINNLWLKPEIYESGYRSGYYQRENEIEKTDQYTEIKNLKILAEASSSELIRSSEFYIKNINKLRYYLKCLLSELEHIKDDKSYSNYLYKIRMYDIRREAKKFN